MLPISVLLSPSPIGIMPILLSFLFKFRASRRAGVYGRWIGWLFGWLVGLLVLVCFTASRGGGETAPRQPKVSPGGSQDGPGRPKLTQDGPRGSQAGPKMAQDSPRGSQDSSKRPKDSPGQPKRLQPFPQPGLPLSLLLLPATTPTHSQCAAALPATYKHTAYPHSQAAQ